MGSHAVPVPRPLYKRSHTLFVRVLCSLDRMPISSKLEGILGAGGGMFPGMGGPPRSPRSRSPAASLRVGGESSRVEIGSRCNSQSLSLSLSQSLSLNLFLYLSQSLSLSLSLSLARARALSFSPRSFSLSLSLFAYLGRESVCIALCRCESVHDGPSRSPRSAAASPRVSGR